MAGDSPNSDGNLRFNHPLYLHPSDVHATTRVSATLTGSDNYPTYSRAMKIALLGKNKLRYVDDSCPRDKQDPDLQATWDRCNAIVLSWLINSIDKLISGGIAFSDSAHCVLADLKERFDKSDNTKIFSLHKAINTLSQGSLSISSYYSKLKDLWDEFDSLVTLPSCSCPTSQSYSKIVQEQRLFQILMGLDESYHQARSHILLLSPLPSVNQAYSLISQNEAQRSLGSSLPLPTPDSTVMVACGGQGGHKGGRGGSLGRGSSYDECSHCHRRGHKWEQCYHLIGFPMNWKPRPLKEQGPRETLQATTETNANIMTNLTPQQYERLLQVLDKDSKIEK